MAADADLTALQDGGGLPAYRASWVDRLLVRLEGLPGPTWLAFTGVAAASLAYVMILLALSGHDPTVVGPRFALISLAPTLVLVLMRHLNLVARESFDRFRPLLEVDEAAAAQLRRGMSVLPERPVMIIVGAVIPANIIGAATAPSNFEIEGTSLAASTMLVTYACLVSTSYLVLTLQIVRQLMSVERIHREAKRIDLFNVTPLHAFSRLTSQASLGLLVLVGLLIATTVPQMVMASSNQVVTATSIALYGGLGVAAIASFVLPLYGLHGRIEIEKERLQADADALLESLLGALHHDTSRLDLSRADGLNKLLGSAFQERELLSRLPTWPWQAATLRAFVSALILPVLVYVLARAAERVVL
jgi:hypothetical protein